MRAALPRFAGISGLISAPARDFLARPACLPQRAFDNLRRNETACFNLAAAFAARELVNAPRFARR
jgi:hypothetical protein